MKKILIIDDNIKLCKSLIQNFEQLGFHSVYATNSHEAILKINNHNFSAILLDVVLGDENGMTVLKMINQLTKTPVIMITGYGTIEDAVKSIKCGAYDYIQKPLDFDRLLKIVENAVKTSQLMEENILLKKQINELNPKMITNNISMLELMEKAQKVAVTNIPILICGENGTGKELFVFYIHKYTTKSTQKMLKINCAALPENLLDNELFGHEKGAYTGADSLFIGVFEKADKGILLLDEIGDMSLHTQAKILRTLQNKEIKRIGSEKIIKIDLKFIASTNKDLEKLIREKKFRQDLFYRLNAATFHIPPLRDRKDDIPLLADYFLQEFSKNNAKSISGIDDPVMEFFFQYNWPGNIRELKNTLNYTAAICSGQTICMDDLPSSYLDKSYMENENNIMSITEKNLIIKILQKTNYNKKKAAEILNISRKTLYNKIEKYGIHNAK